MSASMMPTLRPLLAIASARLTVTVDLPTPPLPDAIAYTLVSEPACAKGLSRSVRPPRRTSCKPLRCSSVMTPISTVTTAAGATVATAAVMSRVSLSLSGQPETVSRSRTLIAVSPMVTASTMPNSVIGRWISGSLTLERASRTCSSVTAAMILMIRVDYHDHACASLLLVLCLGGLLFEFAEEPAEFGAQEVAGGHFAESEAQAGDLAGKELHVGMRLRVRSAVLFLGHPVACRLAVLREQDQRGGV